MSNGTNIVIPRWNTAVDEPVNVFDGAATLLREEARARGYSEIEGGSVGDEVYFEAVKVGIRGGGGAGGGRGEMTVPTDVDGYALRCSSVQSTAADISVSQIYASMDFGTDVPGWGASTMAKPLVYI